MKRLLGCIIFLAFVCSAYSFSLPNGESRLKRCMTAQDGSCIIGRNPPHCDHPNCINGGCVGWKGACAGICYCYGSGYEYRCRLRYCDVVG
ncbi:defensin gallicin-like [Ruditapes philippinarum]|uniref:defensin gallicin-like n=1 Tax=Ruditapes philippinarum TaxID=129788 RepID=UPI00295AC91C|nr:defensin gallicin-like [Ruditapes philippinarum]